MRLAAECDYNNGHGEQELSYVEGQIGFFRAEGSKYVLELLPTHRSCL